ncbi:hypothetical protein A8926_6875 [Saccharopolyspora spinosa]|uniref:Uncharacterized protein n=1 Tax=Saccharopolyspora spinosa TaxID=60894 RepID=A0A2N3Y753_SACSN|nr:hypothetical protein A8926_6875 [Saccharopolyspora spinosa]
MEGKSKISLDAAGYELVLYRLALASSSCLVR